MKKRLLVFVILLLSCFLFSGQFVAQAEPVRVQGDGEYFRETGHWVVGEFYKHYASTPHAIIIYGFPITEEFFDPNSGRRVQYFQNVRFEFHPEKLPGEQVVLTPTGQALLQPAKDIDLSVYTPNCRKGEDWAFPVCYSFQDFYIAYGGVEQFGKPVTALQYSRGRLVQVFEYAKFIWKPENPESDRITLAPLGVEYFYFAKEELSLLQPLKNLTYSLSISELKTRAFTKAAVVSHGQDQIIYITVYDQNAAPVESALVDIVVQYPNGTQITLPTIDTGEEGLAEISFIVDTDILGIAEITATISFRSITKVIKTSFRVGY